MGPVAEMLPNVAPSRAASDRATRLQPSLTPLLLCAARFWLYAAGLTLIGVAQILHSAQAGFWDWRTFEVAAFGVGTPALLRPPALEDAFVYLPGAAWVLAPLRDVPPAFGFVLNAVLMLAATVGAACVARRLYGLPFAFCFALLLAWAPTTYALVIGQNAPVGLFLVLLSLLGLRRDDALLTALPLGLLLYKPTFALPLIGVLMLQRRQRELVIVALCGVGWYFASVAATGGDWMWPCTLAGLEHRFYQLDFAHNAPKAIGLSTLLIRLNVANAIVAACAALLVIASIPLLRRATLPERYAVACLLGLVISPHAWSYDAILVLPLVFFAVTSLREPVRTRVVCTAYGVAPLLLIAPAIGFNPLALVVLGAFFAWFAVRAASTLRQRLSCAAVW